MLVNILVNLPVKLAEFTSKTISKIPLVGAIGATPGGGARRPLGSVSKQPLAACPPGGYRLASAYNETMRL